MFIRNNDLEIADIIAEIEKSEGTSEISYDVFERMQRRMASATRIADRLLEEPTLKARIRLL